MLLTFVVYKKGTTKNFYRLTLGEKTKTKNCCNIFHFVRVSGHPNCQLFITHGGVHSTIESIYHGVPMLAIPVFGDQMGNSLRAQYRGFAAQVPYFELTQEALGSALYRLLNDPS